MIHLDVVMLLGTALVQSRRREPHWQPASFLCSRTDPDTPRRKIREERSLPRLKASAGLVGARASPAWRSVRALKYRTARRYPAVCVPIRQRPAGGATLTAHIVLGVLLAPPATILSRASSDAVPGGRVWAPLPYQTNLVGGFACSRGTGVSATSDCLSQA